MLGNGRCGSDGGRSVAGVVFASRSAWRLTRPGSPVALLGLGEALEQTVLAAGRQP